MAILVVWWTEIEEYRCVPFGEQVPRQAQARRRETFSSILVHSKGNLGEKQ